MTLLLDDNALGRSFEQLMATFESIILIGKSVNRKPFTRVGQLWVGNPKAWRFSDSSLIFSDNSSDVWVFRLGGKCSDSGFQTPHTDSLCTCDIHRMRVSLTCFNTAGAHVWGAAKPQYKLGAMPQFRFVKPQSISDPSTSRRKWTQNSIRHKSKTCMTVSLHNIHRPVR